MGAENNVSDAQSRIALGEARRADRKAATQKARDEQYAKDLEDIERLESEHGEDRVSVLTTPSFVEGLPTVVILRTPDKPRFDRFRTQVRKAGHNTEAIGSAKDMLASSCLIFPDEAIYAKMRESWPSIHDSVGNEAVRLGEAEGKK
jgi:hypothetical protein